ncbi:MAG: succinate dehydrogenase, hydrophobic membrane anchor protein [Halomonas subglaciescola]|nr:succinate dehydrogenase, hydrophobic membrane anchor protein [Halomonas subglaciescola]
MVTSITSFSRNGVSDWLMQRVSAAVLAVYTVFMVAYLLFHPDLDYYTWSGLFEHTWMRIFSLLAFISLAAHAWVGLWTVTTDYLKSTYQRVGAQMLIILVIFVYLVWGIQLLWGA